MGCGGTELKDAGGGSGCGTPGLRAGAGSDPKPRKGRGERQPVPMRGRGLQGRPGATVAGAGGGRHCGGWGSHGVEWTAGAAGGTKKQRETG